MPIIRVFADNFPWKRSNTDHPSRGDAQAGYEYSIGTGTKLVGSRSKSKQRAVDYNTLGIRKYNNYKRGVKHPLTKPISIYNGRTTEVPVGDIERFGAFNKLAPNQIDGAIASEINAAWEDESKYKQFAGVGHINSIRYSPKQQIMEVSFGRDGEVESTVTFLRVPYILYIEFALLAKHNTTSLDSFDGSVRHVLGIRFWDEVRIRGQRAGSKYPYTYITGDGSKAVGSYGEMQDRQNKGADKPLNADLEAALTHTNEPSTLMERILARQSTTADSAARTHYIATLRQRIMQVFGTQHPAYRALTAAQVQNSWPAIQALYNEYKDSIVHKIDEKRTDEYSPDEFGNMPDTQFEAWKKAHPYQ
jgi:hypothetical protein